MITTLQSDQIKRKVHTIMTEAIIVALITGAHNAYALGAQVTHNGKRWRSTVANNVWEPGAYGWEEVTTDE